jgi:uncharacterized protein (DUF433 family)
MKKIICTSGICGGSPRIDGTRLTCADVVVQLAFWKITISEWLATYPRLDKNDILQCLRYCSTKQCVVDKPENYCSGCSLDKREDEFPSAFIKSVEDLNEFARDKSLQDGFLGSLSQYMDERGTVDLWESAQKLINAFRADLLDK